MAKSITVAELQAKINSAEGVTILDVRANQAYEEWHIQGERVHSINTQNSKLKEQGVDSIQGLPQNQEVVAVCAKGIAAQETVALLEQGGRQAVFLEGGMGAWAQYYKYVLVAHEANFSIYQFLRTGKGCLSYMVTSGSEAVVVDAGRHLDAYLTLAQKLNVSIRHVLDTHLHADHISGSARLAQAVGGTYWIATQEMAGATGAFNALEGGVRVPFGEPTFSMVSLRTPGHTISSTSFLVNGRYFLSGDTVFVSGVGRPDLKGKAEEMAGMMYETVGMLLTELAGETLVLPAHYSDYREVNARGFVAARFADIHAGNPLIAMRNEAEFVAALVGRVGATPPNYETITNVNRGLTKASELEQSDLEIGPNRCAVHP